MRSSCSVYLSSGATLALSSVSLISVMSNFQPFLHCIDRGLGENSLKAWRANTPAACRTPPPKQHQEGIPRQRPSGSCSHHVEAPTRGSRWTAAPDTRVASTPEAHVVGSPQPNQRLGRPSRHTASIRVSQHREQSGGSFKAVIVSNIKPRRALQRSARPFDRPHSPAPPLPAGRWPSEGSAESGGAIRPTPEPGPAITARGLSPLPHSSSLLCAPLPLAP